MIDLTPAAIGPYCVPPVNLDEHVGKQEMNVNMVTCGGQATIPMVAAVSRVQAVEYGEIIATVASKSAGPGTRKNIDEFTRTTAGAVERIGGAKRGKSKRKDSFGKAMDPEHVAKVGGKLKGTVIVIYNWTPALAKTFRKHGFQVKKISATTQHGRGGLVKRGNMVAIKRSKCGGRR